MADEILKPYFAYIPYLKMMLSVLQGSPYIILVLASFTLYIKHYY